MFLIEWMFDKMGYQKKVDWSSVFATWDATVNVDPKQSKITVKKPAAKKKVVRKTVRKKA